MTTLATIVLGKIMFYWFITLVDKAVKFFSKDVNKQTIIKILDKLSKNKSFINDVSNNVDVKTGINKTMADKIVSMTAVQSAINSTITKDENRKSIETELKNVFLKAWNDTSIMNPIVSKVKTDMKK